MNEFLRGLQTAKHIILECGEDFHRAIDQIDALMKPLKAHEVEFDKELKNLQAVIEQESV